MYLNYKNPDVYIILHFVHWGHAVASVLGVCLTTVVVVIAQQLISYRQLSRLRKSMTAAGLSHRSCTVSCIGWL